MFAAIADTKHVDEFTTSVGFTLRCLLSVPGRRLYDFWECRPMFPPTSGQLRSTSLKIGRFRVECGAGTCGFRSNSVPMSPTLGHLRRASTSFGRPNLAQTREHGPNSADFDATSTKFGSKCKPSTRISPDTTEFGPDSTTSWPNSPKVGPSAKAEQ